MVFSRRWLLNISLVYISDRERLEIFGFLFLMVGNKEEF